MPDADEIPQRYELRSAPLRLGLRALRVAVAWYLSGAVILTALAAWSASRPADAAAAALIALSAAQVDYFAYVAVVCRGRAVLHAPASCRHLRARRGWRVRPDRVGQGAHGLPAAPGQPEGPGPAATHPRLPQTPWHRR